jgi:bifunctional non-homologous end joining protein LigD
MKLKMTHPDKVLFPKEKITKEELARYYAKVARLMLPLIKDRPISMKRYPKGIKQGGFFQKNAPKTLPSFVKTAPVSRQEKGSTLMVLCNNVETLLWLANQNCITPHIWLSRIDKPHTPDRLIFDLDLPARKDFSFAVEGALILRNLLEKGLKLKTFVNTTGSKGVHIVIPIKREWDFDEVRAFAKSVTELLVHLHPKLFTSEMRKNKRRGKIYLDIQRNGYGQTVVAPFAVRPKEGAPLALPISWSQLKKISSADAFTMRSFVFRNNPWTAMNRSVCSLKAASKRLQKM